MNKLLGLLGIARRAGQLIWGFDEVEKQIKAKKVFLVLLCAGISTRSERNIQIIAQQNSIPCKKLPFPVEEVEKAVAKNAKIYAVIQQGFADKMIELLEGIRRGGINTW